MKQQKFRRYKGHVFYRKKRRWPLVLVSVAVLALVVYLLVHFLQTLSADPSAPSSSSPSSTVTTTTGTPTTTTTTSGTSGTETTTTSTVPTSPTDAPRATGEQIAALAETLIDKPFILGAKGPDAFDNYGLVYYCLKSCNVAEVTYKAAKLYERGTEVAHGEWQRGDVVFFSNDMGTVPDYMGIYIGNGKFVAANNPDKNSCTYNINGKYFSQRYLGARRFSD